MLQEFVPFLDKNNYQIVCFFEFFLTKDDFSANYKEIESALHISSYKLHDLISDAYSLCKKIENVSFCDKHHRLTFTGLDTVTLKKIILHEARLSMRFKIFVHDLLNPQCVSDKAFQQQEGISRATYFRIRNSLNQDLGTDLIDEITTNEVACRFYIFSVLYYFSYLDFPNAEVKKHMIATINRVILIAHLSPTNSQHRQYLYFGFVNFCREKIQFHSLNTADKYLAKTKITPDIKVLREYLSKTWQLTAKRSLWYVRLILTFILATTGTSTKMTALVYGYDRVEKLTNKQLTIIHDFLQKGLPTREEQQLRTRLTNINLKILVPFFFNNSYQSSTNHKYYADSYSTVDKLAKLLVECRQKCQVDRAIDRAEKEQLYYSYLFVLLTEIPRSCFLNAIHIAVDFSQGPEYTNYIMEKITEFAFLNIKIDNFITAKTDIYVTNNFDPSFKGKQIVWDNPPLNKDMLQLRNLIINIKKEKNT